MEPDNWTPPQWGWFTVRDKDPDCRFATSFDTRWLDRIWPSTAPLASYYPGFSHIRVKFVHPLPLHPDRIEESFLGREASNDGRLWLASEGSLGDFISRDDLLERLKRRNDGGKPS